MGYKFKWDMFVTSFLPLWISIILISLWDVISNAILLWESKMKFLMNLKIILLNNMIELILIFIILLLVISSMISINKFLTDKISSNNKPKGTVTKARKANKLTSEFLLAYILPMIAFDFGDIKNIALFIIYFFTLAFLCIRNSNIYTNIYLEFKGYKIYECDIKCSIVNDREKTYFNSVIISPDDLTCRIGNDIEYWDFDNYIYINLRKVR